MLRLPARYMAMACLLVSVWSAIRIASLTVFDALAPLCILLLLLAPTANSAARDKDLRLIVVSQVLFAIAALVSTIPSAAIGEHLSKCIVVSVAMIAMFLMATLIDRKKILTINEAIACIALSAAISSAFVILQGQFRLFTSISPVFSEGVQDWLRSTGLAEHPIEAGAIAGIGMVLALHLLLNRAPPNRKVLTTFILVLFMVVDGYSMVYSASLTAVGSVVAALAAQLLLARRYVFLLVAGSAIPAALIPYLLVSSNLLGDRILQLLLMGDQYTTVRYRQDQLSETLAQIDFGSFMLGHGYSFEDLPQGIEIHNALLASLFHFGVLGLISQLLICLFLLRKLASPYSPALRGALLGLLIVFFAEYLTGPVFARRSNWISAVILASFMPAVVLAKNAARSRYGNKSKDSGVSVLRQPSQGGVRA
ncbi:MULTISPECIES: hypothetical protein [unclassified Bradyrhizobium]|uniref:hypothetical protein n=1 Tax=unclassified Bradyrhizobium TaxID=2631580 RepID=UPI001FFA83C6|nr:MULTISPECIES: hypothetical protein [unclassified Bradyrhizobium]MCK1521652.1 hypothetical protein [Bradyrhizobium sp. 17]MCK1684454.1 hypothetical protein [Bradyrhizobium sp. 145]